MADEMHPRNCNNENNSSSTSNKVNTMDAALNLLISWDLPQLCETFKEQEVCLLAFRHLKDADIEQLIPKIGPRSIFRAMLAQWRAEDQNENRVAKPIRVHQDLNNFGVVKLEASTLEHHWQSRKNSNNHNNLEKSHGSPDRELSNGQSAAQSQLSPLPSAGATVTTSSTSHSSNAPSHTQLPMTHVHHVPMTSHNGTHPHIQITPHSMPPAHLLPPNIPIIIRNEDGHPSGMMDQNGQYAANRSQTDGESETEMTVEADLSAMSNMEDDYEEAKFNDAMNNQEPPPYEQNISSVVSKSTQRLDVRQLLTNNLDGIRAFEYYRERGELDSIHRKRIVRVIISAVLQQCIIMSTNSFTDLANQVALIFPTESAETYYLPRTGTICPKGALYNKYLNMGKQMRRKGILEYRVPRRISGNRVHQLHQM